VGIYYIFNDSSLKKGESTVTSVVSSVFSHTSPVSSSRTAASPKALKIVNREALGSFLSQFCVSAETSVVGLGSDGGAAKALLPPAPIVNQLPTNTQSPSIGMELVDSCIILRMRSLLSWWWSKVWTIFRLETQRVNILNRAAMEIRREDGNPLIRDPRLGVEMSEGARPKRGNSLMVYQ
jgi:hypothetical protein